VAYLHRYRAQTPPIKRDGRKIIRAAISGGKKGEIMRRFAAVLAGLLVPAFLLAGAVVNSADGAGKDGQSCGQTEGTTRK